MPTILNELEKNPHLFDLFQARRLIEYCHLKEKINKESDVPLVTFHACKEITIAPGTTYKAEKTNAYSWKLTSHTLGIYGAYSTLPYYYEQLLEEKKEENKTISKTMLKDFLDIFNHRLIELYYQAWKKNQFQLAYDEAKLQQKTDPLTKILFNLINNEFNEHLKHHEGLLSFIPLLRNRTPTASNLKKILSHYFNIPIKIIEFSPKHISLKKDQYTFITRKNKANNKLGINTILGKRFYDNNHYFKISIGPLKYDQYKKYLPETITRKEIEKITQWYLNFEYAYEIQITLQENEKPPFLLTKKGDAKYLGYNTWITNSK